MSKANLRSETTACPVKKKTKIFTEGGRVEHIALSVEGVFRAYVVNEEDCEVTDCLVNEPGMSLMPGFDLEMPAPAFGGGSDQRDDFQTADG